MNKQEAMNEIKMLATEHDLFVMVIERPNQKYTMREIVNCMTNL